MRLLGPPLLALVLLLSGCGDSSSAPADRPSSSPTVSGPAPPEPLDIAIVSQTAAGGTVDLAAAPVEEDADREAFTAQFQRGEMDDKIDAAIASAAIPEGYEVVGAVVSIGCDVPTGVQATRKGEGWVLEPQMPSQTMQECFAPVTSVALVAVPV